MRKVILVLLAMGLSVPAAAGLEIVPRHIGAGANHAYLHIEFQDAAIYVFDVRFDGSLATMRQMVDAVAAELPLTYTTLYDGTALYGLTYDGHHYQDWYGGYWTLWRADADRDPWVYAATGWMNLTAGDGQWQGLSADVGFKSYNPDTIWQVVPSPVTLTDQSADFTGDGRVTGLDFVIWQANYPNAGGQATQWRGDGNGDGQVTGTDFILWQSRYVPEGAVGPVPEPAGAALLGLGLLGLARRRPR